jgi:hypothetical protein
MARLRQGDTFDDYFCLASRWLDLASFFISPVLGALNRQVELSSRKRQRVVPCAKMNMTAVVSRSWWEFEGGVIS